MKIKYTDLNPLVKEALDNRRKASYGYLKQDKKGHQNNIAT